MDTKKEMINWQRLIITTLLVVVASALTSSITWFILDRTFNENQQVNDRLVNDLEKKITYLGKRIDSDNTVENDLVVNGSVTGNIVYPSSGIPTKIKVFAEDTKTGKTYEATVTFATTTAEMSSSAAYSISVPAGSYYVYGTLAGFNDQNGTPWKAYYNQFVVCGLAASCTDTTKVVVNVESAGTVENITIGDWYPTK
jgi:hypothetical protein